MTHATCISPIDGQIYAERPYNSDNDLADQLARAKTAQRDWRQRSIAQYAHASSQYDEVLALPW